MFPGNISEDCEEHWLKVRAAAKKAKEEQKARKDEQKARKEEQKARKRAKTCTPTAP